MPALTRGPLPARVYWVRRLVVLGVAFLLVAGIARLLGGGSDASSGAEGQAAQAAAEVSDSATATSRAPAYSPLPSTPTGTATTATSPAKPTRSGKHRTASATPLAEPEGVCADDDVAVTPEVKQAEAGRDVRILLQLRTVEAEACTWQVSRSSVTVDITSGKDDIWTSRDCPRAVPTADVVVRREATTNVVMTWNARRSDEECSHRSEWAMPGWYHVTAAALGGEPSDVQFRLETPTRPTVTKTAKPHQDKKSSRDD